MERTPITSSHIVSVGYDEAAQILEVEFKGGAVYQYFRVPEDIYQDFMAAESKGSYFIRHIQKSFQYNKVQS